MSTRTFSASTVIARPPEEVWDLVSDVTRTGEWSPVCRACWWDEGAGPVEGAWFTGRNEVPGRTWETRSRVVAAERGRVFAWNVGGSLVAWAYTLAPVEGGSELTESWELLPDGIDFFDRTYADQAEVQVADRTERAIAGIPVTLAAIKRIAES